MGRRPRRSVRAALWPPRLAIPWFAVLVALAFIALATLRWDAWVGHATIQTTNDAYVRAEQPRRRRGVDGGREGFPPRQGRRSPGADRSRRVPGAGRAGRGRRGGRAGR